MAAVSWEIVSIANSKSTVESVDPRLIVPEFITSNITGRKLNGKSHL